MTRATALGLRSRIVLSLVVVMGLFIIVTELSVSQLARVSVMRQAADHSDDLSVGEKGPDVEKELAGLRKLTLFYLILGACVAIALSYLAVSRTVVAPLTKVTRAVERVAAGDLDARAPVNGSGEMVELGVSFNKMTQTLKDQREKLRGQLEALEKSSTELKVAQDGLVRTAKLASVGTLAAGIAHEIGNPIAGVLGLADALDGETDPKKVEQYVGLIRKEIRRVDKIIAELLLFARPSQRDDWDARVSCDPAEVVGHVESLLSAQRLFDRVDIIADVEENTAAAMAGDDLTQVLLNLFLNAAQAMEGRGEVRLEATSVSSWRPILGAVERPAVRMVVTDNGPGIDEEAAKGIFDPFYTNRKGGGGTGLGLAICQSLCHRAGGDIALDPSHRGGARFVIHIPAA